MTARIDPSQLQFPESGPTRDVSEFSRGDALRERAHRAIPGGAHTYAKGDDQFPQLAPAFIDRGAGCHIWDLDGNEYIEYAMGLRAVTLGHAHPEVVAAASRELERGCNFNRPSPLEVECAETFLAAIDRAEMVKFTKDGSSADTAAVKLARAYTGRDLVAICADHPFFSYDDWAFGVTTMSAGIPPAALAMTLTFRYNDIASVQSLFDRHPKQIACLMLEAERNEPPRDGFLQKLQELCRANGTLLVLDEMITGFRVHNRGAQHVHDLHPDLSTFGKAIANGFALSALAGRREIMDLGGIRGPHERVFLLSTTHGAETVALAAARATMKIYEREPVVEHLYRQGERLRSGLEQAAAAAGVSKHFFTSGRACALLYATLGPDGKPSQPFRTLFLQETIRRGILAPSFMPTYSHSDADIDYTIDAVAAALKVYRQALDHGNTDPYLVGASVKPVYRKFN
jgi:glutamate-1-semialdehyde 2,1-aminomutase